MTIEEKHAYAEGLSFRAIATFLSRPSLLLHQHMCDAVQSFLDFPSNTMLTLTHEEVRAVQVEIQQHIYMGSDKRYHVQL